MMEPRRRGEDEPPMMSHQEVVLGDALRLPLADASVL